MATCYVCGDEINGDGSDEHIILDALGGKLKAKLLHAKCNSEFGGQLDSDFCNQMQVIAKMIGIESKKSIKKRKRQDKDEAVAIDVVDENMKESKMGLGLTQPIMVYTSYASGKTTINCFDTEDAMRKWLRKRYRKLIKHGKTPTWDPETLELEWGEPNQIRYFYNSMNAGKPGFQFGGKSFYQSYLKMSINYYLYNNLDIKIIQDAINHLVKGSGIFKKYSSLHYNKDVQSLEHLCGLTNKIYHLLYLKGDPESNAIYCYIDLFGSHKVISVLSTSYAGEKFEYKWAYDLIEKSEINLENFILALNESYCSSVPFAPTNLHWISNNYFLNLFAKLPHYFTGIRPIINDKNDE